MARGRLGFYQRKQNWYKSYTDQIGMNLLQNKIDFDLKESEIGMNGIQTKVGIN